MRVVAQNISVTEFDCEFKVLLAGYTQLKTGFGNIRLISSTYKFPNVQGGKIEFIL